ncbi:hypothetical protein J3R82DRAFT_3370 [Butyriboletus roseoflavus]|nr:hypothetical protein J3R82DRAFT_3370 [Butyriboletus roseoflavus]
MSCLVRFWILIGSSPLLGPNINKDDPLAILYDELIQNPRDGPASILSNVTVDKCKFYTFRMLVSAIGKQEVIKIALDTRDDWLPINEMYTVERIADEKYLTSKYVCLVIELPQGEKHLFSSLGRVLLVHPSNSQMRASP